VSRIVVVVIVTAICASLAVWFLRSLRPIPAGRTAPAMLVWPPAVEQEQETSRVIMRFKIENTTDETVQIARVASSEFAGVSIDPKVQASEIGKLRTRVTDAMLALSASQSFSIAARRSQPYIIYSPRANAAQWRDYGAGLDALYFVGEVSIKMGNRTQKGYAVCGFIIGLKPTEMAC